MLRFTGCQPPQGRVSLLERRGYWLKAPRPSQCRDPGPADQVPSGGEAVKKKEALLVVVFEEKKNKRWEES